MKIRIRKPFFLLALGIFISFASVHAAGNRNSRADTLPAISLQLERVADSLHSPTAVVFPGKEEIWVTEQTGVVRVIKNGKLTDQPLLDLRSVMHPVNSGYEERGLLGIALHPRFKDNGKFYVFYSAPSQEHADHRDVISEYTLGKSAGSLDPNSGRIIIAMEKPAGNHDGGCIEFGHDGYLYISFGDGGGQGDQHGETGNGQNLNTLLGKILRIDIQTGSGYRIPKDNPFVGRKDMKPEIWAYGFRNPYRFTFDRATGQLFTGDVGQNLWEEVDIVKKGANYGWRLAEGTHCYNPSSGCDLKDITMPITEYSHKEGISVIGGYVYRGRKIPDIKSRFVFADWTGKGFYLEQAGSAWNRGNLIFKNAPSKMKILGFGEDPSGELYMLTNLDTGPENRKGSIYRIIKP